MAYGNMPTHNDGDVFPAADYMTMRGNIEDLDTRLDTAEALANHVTKGNNALDTRVTTAQSKADLAYNGLPSLTKYTKGTAGTTVNSTSEVVAMSQSISVTSATNSVAVIANFDVSADSGLSGVVTSGAGCLVIKCYIDNVVQTGQIIFGTTVATRLTAGQTWTFSNLSVGSHTIELRAVLATQPASNPSYTVQQTHTGFTAIVVNK